MIVGLIGCIVPALPGIPLSYAGILLLHFSSIVEFSLPFLILWAIVVIGVQVLDYYVPIWGAKKFGGGKKGVRGSIIGLVLGMFFIPPWGIILFPFLGAIVGEIIDNKDLISALKAGFGTFLGFLTGTLIKLAVALILTFYFFRELVGLISDLVL